MRTTTLLTIGGRGVCPGGCLPRGCLPRGVSAQGVSAWGCVCPGGRGWSCDLSHHAFDVTCMPPPHQLSVSTCTDPYIVWPGCMLGYTPLWTEWQTGAKILPCPKIRLRVVIMVLTHPLWELACPLANPASATAAMVNFGAKNWVCAGYVRKGR